MWCFEYATISIAHGAILDLRMLIKQSQEISLNLYFYSPTDDNSLSTNPMEHNILVMKILYDNRCNYASCFDELIGLDFAVLNTTKLNIIAIKEIRRNSCKSKENIH